MRELGRLDGGLVAPIQGVREALGNLSQRGDKMWLVFKRSLWLLCEQFFCLQE